MNKNWLISWNQGTGNWTSKKWQMKSNQDQKRWSITSIFWQLCLYVFKVFFSIFQTPKMTTISQAAKSCDLYLSTFMKPLCAPQCLIKCNFLIHLALRSLNASRVPLSNFLKLTNWLEFAHMKDWMDSRSLLHTE